MTVDGSRRTNEITSLKTKNIKGLTDRRPKTSRLR